MVTRIALVFLLASCATPPGADDGATLGPVGATAAALTACPSVPAITAYDLDDGLDAADTGDRSVYYASSYSGTDYQKVAAALSAAGSNTPSAVVLDRVYELDGATPRIPEGVMLTGGGLRRSCAGSDLSVALDSSDTCIEVADATGILAGRVYVLTDGTYSGYLGAFAVSSVDGDTVCKSGAFGFTAPVGTMVAQRDAMLGTTPTSWAEDIVVDSVLFDGNDRCETHTHDWRHANTFPVRGENTVRNSVFYDTPSENLTVCGTLVESNVGIDLGGSFTHGSCSTGCGRPQVVFVRNQVSNANIYGDSVMQHSEGLITLSVNAGRIVSQGNVYVGGGEGVYGLAAQDDLPILAVDDCYEDFPRLISYYNDPDEGEFRMLDVDQVDVGE